MLEPADTRFTRVPGNDRTHHVVAQHDFVFLDEEAREKSLANGENLPQNVGCNIHPWMTAKLLVRDNPYFAVSAEDGTFEIKNVPTTEEIEYVVWHEKAGYLGGLKFTGGETDAKGRFKLKAAADKDLGTITIPLSKIK